MITAEERQRLRNLIKNYYTALYKGEFFRSEHFIEEILPIEIYELLLEIKELLLSLKEQRKQSD